MKLDMMSAAINWVQYKAYELPGDKRDNLLAILRLAEKQCVEDRAIAEKIRKHMEMLETLNGNKVINKQAHNELIMLKRIVKGGE